MGMNVGPAGGDEDQVVSTINTTPLVDVMLVLLIIFMVAAPLATVSVHVSTSVVPTMARTAARRKPLRYVPA